MRKLLTVSLGPLVAMGLMTSPAEAASKRYSISAQNRSYEYVKPGKYTYLSNSIIDVSNGHERDYVLVSGRVKRGPVKGKYVRFYATNTNDPKRSKNTYLGKVRLSKSGKFAKKIRPPRGGRWKYSTKIASSGRYKGTTKTTTMDAFHWTYLYELTDISNIPGITPQVGERRDYVGPDVVKGKRYSGTRWTSQFAIDGGTSVTFRTKAYRCKKLTLKTGVSDRTPQAASSGRIDFSQGSRLLTRLDMVINQTPFDAAGSGSAARKFRDSVKPTHDTTIRVTGTAPASEPDEEEPVEPRPKVRFIVGNAKAFCTFPSINKDL